MLLDGYLPLNSLHQALVNFFGNGLRILPAVYLNGPFCRVENHPTVGALVYVRLQFRPDFRVNGFIEEFV
jgi:hypothetical protein